MLLELALWLGQDIRAFNVFGYITLRTVLAAMTALFVSFALGPRVIRWLAAKKIGQTVRTDGPKTHLTKSGTPTMGGALILLAVSVTVPTMLVLTGVFVVMWVVAQRVGGRVDRERRERHAAELAARVEP